MSIKAKSPSTNISKLDCSTAATLVSISFSKYAGDLSISAAKKLGR
jgi:hypothetical protein